MSLHISRLRGFLVPNNWQDPIKAGRFGYYFKSEWNENMEQLE